jgi:HSP20 family protein
MALVPWTPMRDVVALHDQMNRLLQQVMRGGNGEETNWGASTWVPAVDLYETDEAFVFKAELPGLRKDDIHLEVHDRTLTLRGERKYETDVKDEHYHRRERSYGSFQRVFTLPATVDAEKVQTSFKDGILELRLPKHEAAKPKRIAIQS